MSAEAIATLALAETRPEVFWLDRPERPEPSPCLDTDLNVDLKDLALSILRDAEAIGPTVDGRICSSDRGDGPCLAQ